VNFKYSENFGIESIIASYHKAVLMFITPKSRLKVFIGRCIICVLLFTGPFIFCLDGEAQVRRRIDEVESSSSPKDKRKRGFEMLKNIKTHIKRRYYDPKYRGIDLNKRFAEARESIKKMEYNWQIFREIAQLLLEFNDSHTRFYPPRRSTRVDYGFTWQMIGNKCFVTHVKRKSDAEKQGLKPGYLINSIGRYLPTRASLWKINYLITSLDPVKTIPLSVVDLDGKARKFSVKAKFTSLEERKADARKRKKERKEKRKNNKDKGKKKTVGKSASSQGSDYRCMDVSKELIACKLNTFSTEKKQIRAMMKAVSKHNRFILDLRGNRGGLVKIEQYLTGYFFDRRVKIGDFVTRYKKEERFANSVGDKVFQGELIVLIDSRSASAAEVFARTIQIEKRV